MAIDLTKLSQSELLRLVNATPMGEVLTRSRLRRQMDAGAFRFCDPAAPGQVHIVRYVRWLVGEYEKPRPTKVNHGEVRRRQAQMDGATKAIEALTKKIDTLAADTAKAHEDILRALVGKPQ